MDANDITLMDALFKAYRTKFSQAMADAAGRDGKHGLVLDEIAMTLPSTSAVEVHAWLNQLPSMRKWIGARVVNELTFGKIQVTNQDYENTMEVGVNDVEDDKYGLFTPVVGAMGDACGRLPMELAVRTLAAQNPWADGIPFFAANRTFAAAQTAVITNATTAAFSTAAVAAAIEAMQSFMLAANAPAGVSPRYILVGPSLYQAALRVFERELIVDGGTASNTMKDILTVRVSPLLVGADAGKWFVLGEKSGIKAVGIQERKKPDFARKDKPTDDNVFWKNKIYYGAHARYEGFGTLPFLAYAGGLEDVPDATGALPGVPKPEPEPEP